MGWSRMLRKRWNIRFTPQTRMDYSHIPRGEAAHFRDAVALLFDGPKPPGIKVVEIEPTLFQYQMTGYKIAFEILNSDTIRVLAFERVSSDRDD